MSAGDWIGLAAFIAWWAIGTLGLVKTLSYEHDVDLVDFSFCVVCGMVLGPFGLIGWFCDWHQHRDKPIIVARRRGVE